MLGTHGARGMHDTHVTAVSCTCHLQGEICYVSLSNSALGLVMYASYFVLFLQVWQCPGNRIAVHRHASRCTHKLTLAMHSSSSRTTSSKRSRLKRRNPRQATWVHSHVQLMRRLRGDHSLRANVISFFGRPAVPQLTCCAWSQRVPSHLRRVARCKLHDGHHTANLSWRCLLL